MWLADHLRGKDVLLLAGSNAEAADLSRRVQAKLTQLGSIGPPQAVLADGNHAGIGDLIRARLNTKIDAGGRQLTNRDTLAVTAFRGPDAEVRRQRLDGTWTGTFRVPRSYLARHAELAYAGNVHVAQGRTVDTAHLLVTELAVPAGPVRRHDPRPGGQHRPRRHRHAPPRPGTSPTSRPPPNPSWPASCSATTATCPPPSRSARPRTGPAEPATCSPCGPPPSARPSSPASTSRSPPGSPNRRSLAVPARTLPPGPPAAAPCRPARRARHQRPHRPDHRRARWTVPGPSPASCTAASSGSALPQLAGHDLTWAQRTPASAPAVAHELAAALDDRARALGDRLAASPEPWLARQLGVLAPGASPALREEYARRAGAGRGLPGSRRDHRPRPGRLTRPAPRPPRTRRHAAGHDPRPGDTRRGRHRPRHAPAASSKPASSTPNAPRPPPRPTSPASSGSPPRPKPTPGSKPPTPKSSTTTRQAAPQALASQLAAERQHLEAANARYEERDPPPPRHQGNRRQSQGRTGTPRARPAGEETAGRARRRTADHGRMVAASSKQTSPPPSAPSSASTRPPSTPGSPGRHSAHPGRTRRPHPSRMPGTAPKASPEDEPAPAQPKQDDRTARQDELLAPAGQAARRLAAQHAEQQASRAYAARLEREAQAEPEPGRQAEARDQAEIEM